MKVTKFNPHFIAALLAAGFYEEKYECVDRNMKKGQAYRKDVKTIHGREHTVIIGIFQYYDVKDAYTKQAVATEVYHEYNGQLVYDCWANDSEPSTYNVFTIN